MRDRKITGCHQCQYNGKHNNACLSCTIVNDDYTHPYQKYILPTYDAPQPIATEPEKATNLTDESEDNLRQQLYQIFDLDFSELLLLKCIIKRMTLTEFAEQFNNFIEYNTSKKAGKMTRFCAFHIRERMISKLGKIALITRGQKRPLKEKNNHD